MELFWTMPIKKACGWQDRLWPLKTPMGVRPAVVEAGRPLSCVGDDRGAVSTKWTDLGLLLRASTGHGGVLGPWNLLSAVAARTWAVPHQAEKPRETAQSSIW